MKHTRYIVEMTLIEVGELSTPLLIELLNILLHSDFFSEAGSNSKKMMTYKVSITTGNDANAGTTANVYLTLNGAQKDLSSGSQRLERRNMGMFGRGSTDVFMINCPNLGKLTITY